MPKEQKMVEVLDDQCGTEKQWKRERDYAGQGFD
jgi:hypothetical protein